MFFTQFELFYAQSLFSCYILFTAPTARSMALAHQTPFLPPVFSLLLELAALFHDLGKANARFQEKLALHCPPEKPKKGKKKGDPSGHKGEKWRHELISVLVVYRCLIRGAETQNQDISDISDSAGFLSFSESRNWGWLDDADFYDLPLAHESLDLSSHPALKFMAGPGMAKHPFLSTLLWLIASHHRLPDDYQKAGANPQFFSTLANLHLEEANERSVSVGETPWQNSGWLQEVNRVSLALGTHESLNQASNSASRVEPGSGFANNLALFSALWLRPLLVYADHTASRAISDAPQSVWPKKGAIFANLTSENATGDLLHTHLLSVAAHSNTFWRLATGDINAPMTVVLEKSALRQPIEAPRFAWQQKAAAALALPHPANTASDQPTFVAVIAETGTGKTLGGARIAQSLCGGTLRATFAFGMRSLTLQTGKELFGAGFSHDLAVLVGNPASRILFEKNNESAEKHGSESAEMPLEFEVSVDKSDSLSPESAHEDQFLNWLPSVFRAQPSPSEGDHESSDLDTHSSANAAANYFLLDNKGEKLNSLLSAPLLVCTIDHLIRCVEGHRGGQMSSSLRAMTSDLVLDELDAYSPDDLISISKLVTLHGLAGRHVIVMSATASPIVVNGMFDAWNHGIALRRQMLGHNCSPRAAVVANCTPFIQMATDATSAKFKSLWTDMVEHTLSSLISGPKRRNFDILELPSPTATLFSFKKPVNQDPLAPIWECLATQTQKLHADNHIDLAHKNGNTRVSIGFVRFSTAKNAARFARWALCADHPALKNTRILCYHSKYPMLHLSRIETELNRMLSRKREESGSTSLADDPLIARHLVDETGQSVEDVIFIVSTTTLNETGRDHDYDWCILEPRSVRGEVQAVGRVRRHRPSQWNKINVSFMDRPLGLFRSHSFSPWGFPGIETRQDDNRPTFSVSTRPSNKLRELFLESFPPSFSDSLNNGKEIQQGSINFAINALPFQAWGAAEYGLNAAPCLRLPDNYQANPIGSLEMAEQFACLSSCQPCLPGIPKSSAVFRSNARQYAWFGHHARISSFRRATSYNSPTQDILSLHSPDQTNSLVHIVSSKDRTKTLQKSISVDWSDDFFESSVHPDRVFLRSASFSLIQWMSDTRFELKSLYSEALGRFSAQGLPASVAQDLLLSVDFPPRSNAQGNKPPEEWGWSFHPLLGLWKNI